MTLLALALDLYGVILNGTIAFIRWRQWKQGVMLETKMTKTKNLAQQLKKFKERQTLTPISHAIAIYASNKYASQMPHIYSICKWFCVQIWQNYNQKHCYTYISHYCHMLLNKYVCHIAHKGPMALLFVVYT